ncbi:MAG: hypothetical protein ACFCGT_08305 [Sandaracinaceae bacterium]
MIARATLIALAALLGGCNLIVDGILDGKRNEGPRRAVQVTGAAGAASSESFRLRVRAGGEPSGEASGPTRKVILGPGAVRQ